MYKNNWIPFLILLLVFLQPVMSFGSVPTFSSEIVNAQEEFSLFKTKSSKALAAQEITFSSVDVVVSSASKSKSAFLNKLESLQEQDVSASSNYLIDLRSVLSTQIFPFHFFL